MSTERILIVEDEPAIRELIRLALEEAGYTAIEEAADGERGLWLATTSHPDLILLDLMLPGIDGLGVCRKLKAQEETRRIPIIMLTAKSEETDIVLGLEMGACDYVTKPFSRRILIARIRAHLRHIGEEAEAEELRHAGVVLNLTQHTARLDGKELELTSGEYDLLRMFVAHPGRGYTRQQIIRQTKGEGYPVTERAVDVQMVNLRRKLGPWGAENIETIRGVGYRLRLEA